MPLIDEGMVREQFDGLDPDTAALLRAAMADDLREWGRRLGDAWIQHDEEATSRARHALRGLTGNFGAARLMRIAEQERGDAALAAELMATVDATITAILEHSR